MESEFREGRLFLHRTEAERAPLLLRLARIEGQVRGLQHMLKEDRYCGEELHLMQAIMAAMREVMRLLVTQHMRVGIDRAVAGETSTAEAVTDLEIILQSIVREQ